MSLENGDVLAFYLFGKFGQITHYKFGEWQESFPIKNTKIENLAIDDFTIEDKSIADLRFLSPEQKSQLSILEFDTQNNSKKEEFLTKIKDNAMSEMLYLNKLPNKYVLENRSGEEHIATYSNALEAVDGFSRLYISHQVFFQTKNSHLGQLRKELTALKKKLKSAEKRITELNRASGYKEKADLLMANLWNIEKGEESVTLTSFAGDKEVEIKLKNTLSPQANAEKYYKKGKNESKQRVFALKHLEDMKTAFDDKEAEIEEFEQVNDLKLIRRTANTKTAQKEIRLPYKMVIVDGFEIRIGKGAKDNDELLRVHTTKTDTWLHAKDVSGSHVIIRNPSNKLILLQTLEKVASIAAFHSKAKSEGLAAVIYTDRKYIRKPKGATPGLVRVDKEKVLLVEPKHSFDS